MRDDYLLLILLIPTLLCGFSLVQIVLLLSFVVTIGQLFCYHVTYFLPVAGVYLNFLGGFLLLFLPSLETNWLFFP